MSRFCWLLIFGALFIKINSEENFKDRSNQSIDVRIKAQLNHLTATIENVNSKLKLIEHPKAELNDLKSSIERLKTINELLKKEISNSSNDEAESQNQPKISFDLCSSMSPNLMQVNEADNSYTSRNLNGSIKILRNCAEATVANDFEDGVYLLNMQMNEFKPFCAYCIHEWDEHNGKGWTIIQRREDGSEEFNRNWVDYKDGFGDAYGEYWIGLERIHAMTKGQPHELLISIEDYEGQRRSVKYSSFSIAGEDEDYKLHVNGYDGYIGDEFGNFNGMKFSTYDVNNFSEKNNQCPRRYKGGWWYKDCNSCSNLNGPYYSYSNRKNHHSINWITWLGANQSLKYTHMAIRPRE